MTSQASPGFIIYKPPHRPTIIQPSIILYGSIAQNATVDWRNSLALSLSDLPVAILNPHRDDWDSSWVEDISCHKFKEQVEWEMDHAKIADVIAFHFAPDTLAPVSLLELGMYAETGKAIVCCHPEFKKKGNVQIVCARYGIELVERMEELERLARKKLEERIQATDKD
jgi:hypothetical protein